MMKHKRLENFLRRQIKKMNPVGISIDQAVCIAMSLYFVERFNWLQRTMCFLPKKYVLPLRRKRLSYERVKVAFTYPVENEKVKEDTILYLAATDADHDKKNLTQAAPAPEALVKEYGSTASRGWW